MSLINATLPNHFYIKPVPNKKYLKPNQHFQLKWKTTNEQHKISRNKKPCYISMMWWVTFLKVCIWSQLVNAMFEYNVVVFTTTLAEPVKFWHCLHIHRVLPVFLLSDFCHFFLVSYFDQWWIRLHFLCLTIHASVPSKWR